MKARLIQILILGYIAFATIYSVIKASGLLQLGITWVVLTAAFIILTDS